MLMESSSRYARCAICIKRVRFTCTPGVSLSGTYRIVETVEDHDCTPPATFREELYRLFTGK